MRRNSRTISQMIPPSRRRINPRSRYLSRTFHLTELIWKKATICRTVDSNKRWKRIIISRKLVNDRRRVITTSFVRFLRSRNVFRARTRRSLLACLYEILNPHAVSQSRAK